jgi:4-hydroxybenzoate polyprenyltransferase
MIGRIRILLELVRPFTLIAPIAGFLSGAIIASGSIPGVLCFLGALSAALLNAASNTVNQYFDLEIDKLNKPFRPLPSGRISRRTTLIFGVVLYVSALALAWVINFQLFTIILFTAVISFFYSAPPIRLKKRAFINNLSIAVPRGMLLIVAGWSSVKSIFHVEPWYVGLLFSLYLTGAVTTKDFADIKGDRQFGIHTLPVLYGPRKTVQIISPFLYLPFMLIPLGFVIGILRPTVLPLTLLLIWGVYTVRLLTKNPEELTLEKNHISWKHMYGTLIIGQLGFAVAYLIKI